jgi:hypothetical protein
MGLDAYIHEVDEHNNMSPQSVELWYARKVWPIQDWMTQYAGFIGEEDGPVPITPELLEHLKKAYVEQVLLLMPGDFKGLNNYCTDRLKELIDTCTTHLTTSTKPIVYYGSY